MSNLPQYQRVANEDDVDVESAPFLKGNKQPPSDVEAQVPPYPSAQGESSGTTGEDTRHTVTYIFEPRWPVQASKQEALGVLGQSKEETIDIVRRGFPILASYPPNHLEFFTNPTNSWGHAQTDKWVSIMDETWARLLVKAPTSLVVRLRESVEDRAARKAHERMQTYRILAWLGLGWFIFFFTIWLLLGRRHGAAARTPAAPPKPSSRA